MPVFPLREPLTGFREVVMDVGRVDVVELIFTIYLTQERASY